MKKKNIPEDNFLSSLICLDNLYNLVFFAAIFILLLLQFNPMMFTGGDNAHYISLADSIFQKGTYQLLYKVGTPYETAVTPGYPILLGLTKLIFPNDYTALKYLSFIMFFISMIFAFFLLMHYRVKKLVAYGFILIMVLSNSVSEFSSWVLTESTFMAFSFGSILYFEKRISKINGWKSLIIPSLFIISAVYIRLPAGMILPTVFVYLWLKKNMKVALKYAVVSFVFILPWLVWMVAAPNEENENIYLKNVFTTSPLQGETETAGISDFAERISDNSYDYFLNHMPDIFVPNFRLSDVSKIEIITGLFIIILLLIGAFESIKSKEFFPILYLIFYLALLMINRSARLRYLVVALPMFFLLIYYASLFFSKYIKRPILKHIPITLLLLATLIPISISFPQVVKLTGHVRKYKKMGYEYAGLPSQWVNFLEVAKWVGKNSPKDAIILSRKPRMFYLYSGRQGRTFQFEDDPKVVFDDIIESNAFMVILDQVRAEGGTYLYPTLVAYEDYFQVAHVTSAPETYAIYVKRDVQKEKLKEEISK